ncbi:hypothetical protein ON010_g11028 [Phytophthora cinnamomi]|nr:hypothetical protein ON010_g11028 [Phytophthora cinnamomi]
MIPTGYALALMPEACGFYILGSHSADPDSSSSAVIQVRQVEFQQVCDHSGGWNTEAVGASVIDFLLGY